MKCGIHIQIVLSIFHRLTLAKKKRSSASVEAQLALLLCVSEATLHTCCPFHIRTLWALVKKAQATEPTSVELLSILLACGGL